MLRGLLRAFIVSRGLDVCNGILAALLLSEIGPVGEVGYIILFF